MSVSKSFIYQYRVFEAGQLASALGLAMKAIGVDPTEASCHLRRVTYRCTGKFRGFLLVRSSSRFFIAHAVASAVVAYAKNEWILLANSPNPHFCVGNSRDKSEIPDDSNPFANSIRVFLSLDRGGLRMMDKTAWE